MINDYLYPTLDSDQGQSQEGRKLNVEVQAVAVPRSGLLGFPIDPINSM